MCQCGLYEWQFDMYRLRARDLHSCPHSRLHHASTHSITNTITTTTTTAAAVDVGVATIAADACIATDGVGGAARFSGAGASAGAVGGAPDVAVGGAPVRNVGISTTCTHDTRQIV